MKKAENRLKTSDMRLETSDPHVSSLMSHVSCLMSRVLCFASCALCLVSPSYGDSDGKTNYYSPESVLKFANYLYQEGDYLRAAGEYQRYLLYCCEGVDSPLWKRGIRGDLRTQETPGILYKIGLCYRQAGDTERAISFFRKIVTEHPESRFAASYQIAYSHLLSGQYERSIQYINQILDETKNSDEQERLQILATYGYLHQRRWRDAEHILQSLAPKDENLNLIASGLRTSAREGMSLPRRNPILAGLFSAVLPGTGKVYCKQYGDGFYSLILVGVTGLLAWDGFRENGIRSVRGWLFGGISGVFYAGNVYGSTIAARIYNRQLEADVLKRLPAVPDDQ
jgi:tetratricopeptide (TPR) repeat protein